MKPKFFLFRTRIVPMACLTVAVSNPLCADEIKVDPPGPGATDLVRTPNQTVWFDSGNLGTPVAVSTINGVVPATGILPGWAHTQYSFVKYDGANVIEIPNTEKIVGAALLTTATGSSDYYDNLATTTMAANQTIGLIETTRDFEIAANMTLNVALGGVMFHNNSHWVKAPTGTASITSSSNQLVAVANGNATDYQFNAVIVKDFDATHPLQFIKTGPDPLNLSAASTYTGGTLVLNGVLRGSSGTSFGTQTVKVMGDTSQLYPSGAATYANNIEITGQGPASLGALRLGNGANLTGSVTLTGESRISAQGTETGTIAGTLIGTNFLNINAANAVTTGTVTLNGSAAGFTGDTGVYGGRLNINGAFGGKVTVYGAAGIGGKGTLAKDLEIGEAASPSILYVNGSIAGALTVAGNVNIYGPTQLLVSGTAAGGVPFPVLKYNTITGLVTDISAAGVRDGVLTNDTANKALMLSFTPGTITWTGAANANWTANTDVNFTQGGTPTQYFNGDNVIFDDTSTVQPSVVGTLYPNSVTFGGSNNLVVTGTAGGFAGTTGVVKNGTGILTLGGALSVYTGAVAINQGVLKMGVPQALGSTSGITVAQGAQLDINGTNASDTTPARAFTVTLAGNGPDNLGAITNTSATNVFETSGIRNLILTADASIGGNAGRYDVGFTNNVQGTITGNSHTLTKVGTNSMGFRGDAGGTPINFVIAGGRTWGENTDNAWGGTTGTLTIKSGAFAGTYGTRTIATPVTIESGGTLYNEGGGTGTWTGPIVVTGAVKFDAGTAVALNGKISGTGSVEKTGANTVAVAHPEWSGDTTVTAGTLSLTAPNPNNDGSAVRITGALNVLSLNFTNATDTVKEFYLDDVAQPAGVYSSATIGARIIGPGTLTVTSGGSTGGYTTWASQNGIAGVAASVDSDGDGLTNGIEFVVGGVPIGANSNSAALAPIVSTDATYLIFNYRRSTLSQSAPAAQRPYVQYGTTLGTWKTAAAGTDGVLIEVGAAEVSPGILPVTVKIPKSLAADGKIFSRLRIDLP